MRQEAVKKAPSKYLYGIFDIDQGFMKITPESIRNLRNTIDETLEEFGVRLAHGISPHHRPFTKQYIHRLEKGQDRITPEIEAAYWNIATALDDVPAGTGGAVSVNVRAQPNQIIDGAFIPRSALVLKCANPRCAVQFIRTSPRQKYHDPDCRKASYRVRE
jgi:hypothetical protein